MAAALTGQAPAAKTRKPEEANWPWLRQHAALRRRRVPRGANFTNNKSQMTRPQSKGITPPDDVRTAIESLIEEVGEKLAAERVEVSRQTLARIVGGMPIHRSTIGWVRLRLGLSEAAR